MKIVYKMITGFMIVAVLTAAVAHIGMTTTGAIGDSNRDMKEETIPFMNSIEKVEFYAFEKTRLYTHVIMSDNVTPGDYELLKENSGEFDRSLDIYEELVKKKFPDEIVFLGKIKSANENFEKSGSRLMEMKRSGIPVKGSDEYEKFSAAKKELLEAIGEAHEKEYEEFNGRIEHLDLVIASARNSILLVSLITFILSLVIGAVISVSISRPMIRLKDAADEIRRGKLDTVVEIKSNDETGVLAGAFNKMVRDLAHEINEHKQTAANLLEKNEFVKTVLESLPYPFYVIDAKDHTITLANPAACVMGFVDGTTCYALTHKTDKPCGTEGHLCPLEEVKRTGKPAVAEHLHYDKNGNVRNMEVHCYPIFDSNGNVVQAIEYSLDITERKRAQEALAESEERFRSVSQSANDAIITSDSDGNIIFWNNGAQKIFGYQSDEILGKPLTILMPQRYREAHIKGLDIMRTTGESPVIGKRVELEALRKDGSEFPTELSLSTWKTGEKTFYSGILRDITERRCNEEIQRENERLAFANRAKSEFLMVMSHELRTPLNAIIGFSELLKIKDVGGMNEKQQRYTENVITSGKQLLRIIDDILDLTRVESGKMELAIEHVSVPVAVNEVLETIKEKAEKQNVIIKKDLEPGIEFIDTDGQKFRHVLNNLLGNAVKFSKPEGGTITITAVKEGDMAKFSVSDTGIGIKEEDMGRLFQSFEQLDAGISRKYGGTGLGLAVSKKLVELLGGWITVESRYGEGSKFTFYLPLASKKDGG